VLDETLSLASRLNEDMVARRPLEPQDEWQLLTLVEQHLARTLSPRARDLVVAWHRALPLFRKVAPLPPPAIAPMTSVTADPEPAEEKVS
jgi:glutamate synthase domain-containing protein 3